MTDSKTTYVIFEKPEELDDLLVLLKKWPDDGILYKVDRDRSRIDFWGRDREMVTKALMTGKRTIFMPDKESPE